MFIVLALLTFIFSTATLSYEECETFNNIGAELLRSPAWS